MLHNIDAYRQVFGMPKLGEKEHPENIYVQPESKSSRTSSSQIVQTGKFISSRQTPLAATSVSLASALKKSTNGKCRNFN